MKANLDAKDEALQEEKKLRREAVAEQVKMRRSLADRLVGLSGELDELNEDLADSKQKARVARKEAKQALLLKDKERLLASQRLTKLNTL